MRWLTAIPVYNEVKSVCSVLAETRRYAQDLLVVDDGSSDGTSELLASEKDLARIVHQKNLGYGAAIRSAFCYAIAHQYDFLITMDCDGQHQPDRIPVLLEQISDCDMVSGSRYLRDFRQDTPAPNDRRYINATITNELNEKYGLAITDGFCGFKAYRVSALADLRLTDNGYGMPLELWVQAAKLNWRIREIGVPRLYLDPNRAFGGILNDPTSRLAHYRSVIELAERSFVHPTFREWSPSC
jgi:glycosyltransferase involved in cell wall biosynthesis